MEITTKDYNRWIKLAIVVCEGDKYVAEEVLQNVMIELIKKIEDKVEIKSIDSYIFISLKNRYINYKKKANKHRDRFLSLKRDNDGDNYEDTIESIENPIEDLDGYDFDRDVDEKIKVDLIEEVSMGLNFFDKQLFLLHYVQKIPQRKISRDADITMGVIHQRLAKIKRKIIETHNNRYGN